MPIINFGGDWWRPQEIGDFGIWFHVFGRWVVHVVATTIMLRTISTVTHQLVARSEVAWPSATSIPHSPLRVVLVAANMPLLARSTSFS